MFGFDSDLILFHAVSQLIKDFSIATVVETGTWREANTTRLLSRMVPKVYTIEANSDYYAEACQHLASYRNVSSLFGESHKMLPKLIPKIAHPTLYYLDAHWGDSNPLLDELRAIAELDPEPTIVIHDMKVPGHSELGFDTYGGQDYEFSWVEPELKKLQCPWRHFYNTVALGAMRGVLFVVPMKATPASPRVNDQ